MKAACDPPTGHIGLLVPPRRIPPSCPRSFPTPLPRIAILLNFGSNVVRCASGWGTTCCRSKISFTQPSSIPNELASTPILSVPSSLFLSSFSQFPRVGCVCLFVCLNPPRSGVFSGSSNVLHLHCPIKKKDPCPRPPLSAPVERELGGVKVV